MVSPTDPKEVRFTGENSVISLFPGENRPLTTRASHWRTLLSPAGQGHVLFLKSELTGNQVRVYADKIALARYLQEEIISFLFPEASDQSMPVVPAVFDRTGDARTFWTETIYSAEESISMTWYDFAEPFVNREAASDKPPRPLEVYSCIIPARRADVSLNGVLAGGQALPDERDGKFLSSACLALSETWLRPKP